MAIPGGTWLQKWWAKPANADNGEPIRWWYGSSAAAVFFTAAYVVQVELGADLPPQIHYPLLFGGASSALLSFLLPIRAAAAARTRAKSAVAVASNAVRDKRVELNQVLTAVARQVGLIAQCRDAETRRALRERLKQLVVNLTAQHVGGDRTRACFFKLEPGPPRSLEFDLLGGRQDEPRGPFEEGTDRGMRVFKAIDDRQPDFEPNTANAGKTGYDFSASSYKTFIGAPVIAGAQVMGYLTVDAPNPGELSEDDVLEVAVLADLLACGLARP